MNNQEITTVTYNFEDGTRILQPINKECLFDSKGRRVSVNQLNNLFESTAYDKKATSFSLESIESPEKVENVSEFSKIEKYNAKKDYRDFRKENNGAFKNQKSQFQAMVVDKFKNTKMKIRYNVSIDIAS
jgi:arginyl-tRNA--protein-N-Asp/Glu arginylyltransferase